CWLESADDSVLKRLYEQADGLLMASEAEGFGLPIIEAARHDLPILLRDIPVFREVAGDHATYFHGTAPDELQEALTTWLSQVKADAAPPATGIAWQTWSESTQSLMDLITDNQHPHWAYTYGGDSVFETQLDIHTDESAPL